jgi:hypothetical protein
MPKEASLRKAKYNAKYDPEVVKTRFTAAETAAKEQFGSTCDSLVAMEIAVQTVLNTDDIPGIARPLYYNFGREIWTLVAQGQADPALTSTVVDVLYPKYVAMGGLSATLISIALNVFSITIPPP